MKKLWIVGLVLIVLGYGLILLARYKIRSICEKYPIEEQLKHEACCQHGGPWPQITKNPTPQNDGLTTK